MQTLNPVNIFYANYKSQILGVRNSLFSELELVSKDFSEEARKILDQKILSNNNLPLLGELFPWIIRDLIKSEHSSTHKISVGWLAIYLYTLFLDEYVDNPNIISSKKFITGSLLAKSGLLKISRITNNTPFENYVDDALSYSALNQSLDVTLRNKVTKSIDAKENYSKGKNYILLACAGALAAENSKYSNFITEFTESLLLSLQYLDDITDYKEDFYSGNLTVLLNEAFKENQIFLEKSKNVSNDALLSELISTGALQRTLEKILHLLNKSMKIIDENHLTDNSDNSAIRLFFALKINISTFIEFLKTNCIKFKNLPEESKKYILDESRRKIGIIAQST